MNILLVAINAKYIHSNLAVYSLRASADAPVSIAEYTINNSKDYILQELYKKKPDILCFSCYIWNLDFVEEISREFHKLCPQVPLWAGGPEVSYETRAFLEKNTQFTGVMIGEGERTFRTLCQAYLQNEHPDLSLLSGIAYRGKDGICFTSLQQPLDLSELPFCYEQTQDFSNRIIYYESSRGCPFSCSYCLSSVEKKLRFRSLEQVTQELQFFIDQRVPQIKFVDRTFNCNHAHAMAIWQYIKEHDNGVTNFHFEISADLITDEELKLLQSFRPGLIQLEIGVQSTNEATIEEIHRKMSLDRLKEVVRRIQSFGNIHQHLDLIAGLPFETYERFSQSFDEIYALQPDQLQLGFLKLLKGSYMYTHASEYGMLYHERPPYEILSTNWLSYEEILHIKEAEEMLEVYYNSRQFELTIKLLLPIFDSAFSMFQQLGAFYAQKGYASMSHSRIRRCEILLEFIQEKLSTTCQETAALIHLYQESLLFDLYARENCKSRPSWGTDVSTFRSITRQYCKKGKLSHLEPFHYQFPDAKNPELISTLPSYQENPIWILFDYEERNPLSHQASIQICDVVECE